MSRSKLIRFFSEWVKGPIDIEDHIRPELIKFGVKDEIWFWADDKLDPEIVRGEIEHWEWPEYPNGPAKRVADITYSAQMQNEWQRLVCCKEMLHLLDHHPTCAPEDIEALVEKIVLPADLQDPFTDGKHALADRVTVTYANAILFPFAAREIFLEPYSQKRLSAQQIADKMEIPLRSVVMVMSDMWPEIHDLIIGSRRTLGPDRVSSLKQDNSPLEVHSVPVGIDPYSYAKRMAERDTATNPVKFFLIETNGTSQKVSREELVGKKSA